MSRSLREGDPRALVDRLVVLDDLGRYLCHIAEATGLPGCGHLVLARIRIRVMEVGAGNGLNFPHYPSSIQEVVAVEPEPYLRARAVGAPDGRMSRPAPDAGRHRPGLHHRNAPWLPFPAGRGLLPRRPADPRRRQETL